MLTEQEARVAFAFLHDGATNEIVARRVGINIETVKTYMRRLLEKTGTDNRAAFAVIVLTGGVVLRGPIPKKAPLSVPHGRFQQAPYAESRTPLCPPPRTPIPRGPAVGRGAAVSRPPSA